MMTAVHMNFAFFALRMKRRISFLDGHRGNVSPRPGI
jgi:hypothetical protein